MILKTLEIVLNWSEVWALFIPLLVWVFRKKQPGYMRPVILYIWVAFFLNLAGDIIGDFKFLFPDWLQSNNPLYNIHSLVRFVCFSYFFQLLGPPFRKRWDKIVASLAMSFILLNFIFIEKFFDAEHLSGNLLALESFVLLIYCLQYYLFQLKQEESEFSRRKDFWVVTGLAIYVVLNFFIFLFYVPLLTENPVLADRMWSIHNIAYIVLCIFIANAFHEPA